jgi:hypothetical protein
MAEVYRQVNGVKIEKFMADNTKVQWALTKTVQTAALRGKSELAQHRDSGDATVFWQKGDVDRYLVLEDRENGVPGAMSIEFGRRNDSKSGGMYGLYILHRALNIGFRRKAGRVGRTLPKRGTVKRRNYIYD